MWSKFRIILISLLFLNSYLLIAQSNEEQIIPISWKRTTIIGQDSLLTHALVPQDFSYELNEHFLPTIHIVIPWNSLMELDSLHFSDVQFTPANQLDETIQYPFNSPVDQSFDGTFEYGLTRSASSQYLEITIPAYRINQSHGMPEMITLLVLNILPREQKRNFDFSHHFQTSSVLRDGYWYKIGVENDGVYRISASELQNMGFSSPLEVNVFGNLGGLLSLWNDETNQDDLIELPVLRDADGIRFFARGPHRWAWDDALQQYRHVTHLYSKEQYYFLTSDKGEGKSIQNALANSNTVDSIVDSYLDLIHFERNDTNLIKSGRQWYGEEFYVQLQRDYVIENQGLRYEEPIDFQLKVLAHSTQASRFIFHPASDTILIPSILLGSEVNYANEVLSIGRFNLSAGQSNLRLEYLKANSSSKAWLDYLSLALVRDLRFEAGQQLIRNKKVHRPEGLYRYQVDNMNARLQIWEVSDLFDVKSMIQSASTGDVSFVFTGKAAPEFILFDSNEYLAVNSIEEVPNQNIHSSPIPELTIVFPEYFRRQAEALADLHRTRDDLFVLAVSDQEVYNEFSSGVPDIAAVRNMMKMFYNRGQLSEYYPKYLLFFGDASYNNKPDFPARERHLLSYQNANSLHPISSVGTDDFFGFLDEDEGDFLGKLDLGIGRIPVSTLAQADLALSKIEAYYTDFGNWRNLVTLIADDPDSPNSNAHMNQAESIAAVIADKQPSLNVEKIYLDAYPQVSTASGDRYPDAQEAVNRKVNAGSLIVNYTGHGNEIGLTHERVITVEDITNWTNEQALSLFVTATCEFSRFDDHNRVSGGEYVFRNEKGGGIALITTSRSVYYNSALNLAIYNLALQKEGDAYPRLGDIIREAKNQSSSVAETNIKKYYLLGDPALRLAIPELPVSIDSINSVPVSAFTDTVGALSKVHVTGYVGNNDGSIRTNFSGTLATTVYDKSQQEFTLGNEGNDLHPYLSQNKIIYKGRSTVSEGRFAFEFIVPKDIAYFPGRSKMSFYASDDALDGAGSSFDLIIGGTNADYLPDLDGPELQLFMNNTAFRDGGLTDENPTLLVYLRDESGINTVGNGIGHDVTARMDGLSNQVVVLNDFYEPDLDTYQSGVIRYPLNGVSVGFHEIEVKVWDIHNNSAESSIRFEVRGSDQVEIGSVSNYPNPFSDRTHFYFEHNQGNGSSEASLRIYSMSGHLVKTIYLEQLDAYRTGPIEWDGRSDSGDLLPGGVYFYQLLIANRNGEVEQLGNKLLMVR